MANFEIPDKTLLTSVDRATDSLLIYDADALALKRATVNNLLDLTSHPVGINDTQTLTAKTLTSPTISSPVLSGTVTGTYTLAGTPTFPAAVVTLTDSQTLTNKVLTSPTINTATIANPTLTVDTVSEFTAANGVTVDGLNIKDSKLNTNNSVVTNNITNGAVTASKLGLSPQTSSVATNESTTSLTYVALATAQSFSVIVGANGLLLVAISALVFTSVGGPFDTYMSFSLSGANTLAASDGKSVSNKSASGVVVGATFLLTGLNAGSTTVTALHRVSSASTGNFVNRNISAIPL